MYKYTRGVSNKFPWFLYTAVHVIIYFTASFLLLCFLFQFIDIPQEGWDGKKYKEKENNR